MVSPPPAIFSSAPTLVSCAATLAIVIVPVWNGAISKAPTGPFQTSVRAGNKQEPQRASLGFTPWLQALRSASAADRAGVSFPRYRCWNFARQPSPKVRPWVHRWVFRMASGTHFQTG
jgi:hypothetical protein